MKKLKDTDANQNYFQIKVEVMMMQVMFDFERAVIQNKNLACCIFPKDSHILIDYLPIVTFFHSKNCVTACWESSILTLYSVRTY